MARAPLDATNPVYPPHPTDSQMGGPMPPLQNKAPDNTGLQELSKSRRAPSRRRGLRKKRGRY